MKILVTGFGPFDHFSSNPSEDIARTLSDENDDVEFRTLPVIYGEGGKALIEALKELDPDLVICFGLNGTISHIALEEIALNLRSSEIPDSSGRIVVDEPIFSEEPLALRSCLPNRIILDELRKNGIPVKISYSAGTYLCNEVFFTLMKWCRERARSGGFIHVPMATEMIAMIPRSYSTPHMSMEMLLETGKRILAVSRIK